MNTEIEKTNSEPSLNCIDDEQTTPSNFVSHRTKRRRASLSTDDFEEFKTQMKLMFESYLSTQTKEIQEITNNIKTIQQSNNNIESSITFLMTQNEELKKKIENLEIQARKDKEYILILEEKLEDTQRSCRKTSIEIKNVPKLNQESRDDLVNMLLNLTKSINCPIDKREIKDIYRVKPKKDGTTNTPIIAETCSTIIKSDILKMCKSFNIRNKDKLRAKHLGMKTKEDTPIFVSEQLTSKNARLFFLARELTRNKKYKFCWTSFGKIFIRKDEGSPIIRINNETQIQGLMLAT